MKSAFKYTVASVGPRAHFVIVSWCTVLTFLMITFISEAQTGSVKGKVMSDGVSVPFANIRVQESTLGTVSDADGSFLLENIPTGKRTLEITFIGFDTALYDVSVKKGETTEIASINLRQNVSSLEEFVIEGEMKEGEKKAIMMMMESKRVAQISSSERIEKLPDKNAAEALQRMPGVVMESDHGEGQYISFRGTPTDWSSVTINGDRMPVANEEIIGRALNLDVLPTSLIGFIEYNQSITPDIEGDAIGGSANFITRQIPTDSLLEIDVSTGYNQKAQKPMWNGSILAGSRFFNGKLGAVAGVSAFRRNWSTDNQEIFYGSNINHSLSRMELRKYNGVRQTIGAHAKLDYRISKRHTIYALAFTGQMQDDEYNRKTMYAWSTGVGQSIRLQSIHNILQHGIRGGSVGGEHQIDKRLTARWEVAQYESRFGYGSVPFDDGDERNGYYVVEFELPIEFTDFLYQDANGNQVGRLDDYDSRLKFLDIDSPVEGYGDNYTNIQPSYIALPNIDSSYVFTRAYTETNKNIERDPLVAKLDFDYKVSEHLTIYVGGKYRTKTGTREVGLEAWQRNPFSREVISYDRYEVEDIPNKENFLRETGGNYSDYTLQFLSEEDLDNFIEDSDTLLTYLPFGESTPFYPQFVGSSFDYEEDAYAGYVMATWKARRNVEITGGLRYEETQVLVTADTVIKEDIGIGDTRQRLEQTRTEQRYPAFLPMATVKWSILPDLNLIYASTRTYRRVNFNEVKPGEPELHYTHFHMLRGNPSLRPTYSWNNDLSIQKFFGLNGLISVALYHKYVVDHIYTAFQSDVVNGNTTAGQFSIPGGVVAKRYENAPWAHVGGFEIAMEKRFPKAPSILRHFGLGANYSLTESRMKVPSRDELQPMTRQSRNVLNTRVSFETERFQANLGLTYRDPYLMELNLFAYTDPETGEEVIRQENDYDVYMGRSLGLDGSIRIKITNSLYGSIELMNLLNTEYVEFRGQRERPVKTEYYGIRGLIGIKYEFFQS